MFRKIVSQLSFSPALVGQLGFYARRLRKEETTRRMGLIFVALALVVQALVVFQPPAPANAANNNDFIPGGLGLGSARSLNNFLSYYDHNERHMKDIFNYFGITRSEITSTSFGYFLVGNKKSYGFETRANSTAISITNADFKPVTTIYGRPMSTFSSKSTKIYAYIGHSSKIGWFAIMQACGNLVTDTYPPQPKPPADIAFSKTAHNITQGNVDATKTTTKVKDRLNFTLTATNSGGTAGDVVLEDNIGDALEYAKLTDNGGGVYDPATRKLTWPTITLGPGEQQVRTFTMQVLNEIPATPRGLSDPSSYDCQIENAFYTSSVILPLDCSSPPKVVEKVVTQLPHTGPGENMLFAGIVLAVVVFFYLRSKQLGAEVRLIRRDINGGTI